MVARAEKTRNRRSFLPEGAALYLQRRLRELVGLGLMSLAGVFALALASFNPDDPSLSTSTMAPPENLMGATGALLSDIFLQSVGLSSFALILVLLAWSWRLMTHQSMASSWLQAALLPLGLIVFAVAWSAVPATESWPVRAGFGGVLGFEINAGLASALTSLVPGWPFWITPVIALAIALSLLVFSMGLSREEWVGLGRIVAWPPVSLFRLVREIAQARAEREIDEEEDEPAPKKLSRREKKKDAKRKPVKPRKAETASRVATKTPVVKPGKRAAAERQPALDLEPTGEMALPPLALLNPAGKGGATPRVSTDRLEQNARMLESVLDDFGVQGEIVEVRPGPVVTLYELEPAPGTKSSRVIGLADDIARSMSAISARVAVVPGRNAIGIELPNAKREMVYLRELLSSAVYEKSASLLALALGKDIGGTEVIADLTSMPHLLIAGTTGSGKSVAINTMILSLLYRLTPDQCRFIMIDPKMLELSVYDGIPHLLTPVVTDPRKAVVALKWAVREMEDRYRAMSQLGVRNLTAYNTRIAKAQKKGETLMRTVQTGFDASTSQPVYEQQVLDLQPLPLIVVVVDEMADLMMVAGKDVEGSIQRLAQMARAAGIHIIMATQRPSVDVITGTIKANFPTRISFQVSSKIDSRTILGEQGAEQLLGEGDMLYLAGGGRLTRVHGPFVSDEEVEDVVRFLLAQGRPDYLDAVTEEPDGGFDTILEMGSFGGPTGDDLYDRAVALVASEGKASTSFVQRHLQIGYNRAARIIEQMEKEGVIGPANHVGKREVLVGDHSGD